MPADLLDRRVRPNGALLPPASLLTFGAVDDFQTSGQNLVRRLADLGGLTPSSDVLDVGSGIGRLAIPLTSFLGPQGSYHGLDIVQEGVEWCEQNIAARHPNFAFQLADVYNGEYHPTGTVHPSEYRFPYADASFDLIVLNSVFTHMLPNDMEQYLREIARVLRVGGRSFTTYSLLDDQARVASAAHRSDTRFNHDLGPCSVVDRKVPELAVAYDPGFVRDVHERHGLSIDGVYYGDWCRRSVLPHQESRVGQDVVIATKR